MMLKRLGEPSVCDKKSIDVSVGANKPFGSDITKTNPEGVGGGRIYIVQELQDGFIG